MPQGPLDAGPTVGGRTGCPCSPQRPPAALVGSAVGHFGRPDHSRQSAEEPGPLITPRRPGCFSHRGCNDIYRGMPPASGEVRNSVLRRVSVHGGDTTLAGAVRSARLAPAADRTRVTLPQVRLLNDLQIAHRHRHIVLNTRDDVPNAVTLDVTHGVYGVRLFRPERAFA